MTEPGPWGLRKGMSVLRLIQDNHGDKNAEFQLNGEVILGREAPSEILLPHREVSRKHARIFQEGGNWFIEDLNSANGTIVNGTKVQRFRLTDGDTIRLSSFTLVFCDSAAPDSQVSDSSFSAMEASIVATHVPGDPTRSPTSADRERALERRLEVLYKVSRSAAGSLSVKALLKVILNELFQIFIQAEYGFVILRDPQSEKFSIDARRKRHPSVEEHLPSKTIVKYASQNMCALLSTSAMDDARFRAAQSLVEARTTSVICAPLITDEKILGLIYIATRAADRPFSEGDLQLVSCVADTAAVFLQNARLHEQALRSQRLAAIGQAIAGMAHCIKNILNGLQGGSFILDQNLGDSPNGAMVKGWDMVKRNMRFLSDIVLDMLSYSKKRKPLYGSCSINEVCRAVYELVRPQAERNSVNLVFRPSDEVNVVHVDEAAIKRCLMNLLGNAVDACEKNTGQVSLEVGAAELSDHFAIRVRDNGCGIDPEACEKIFDVFFSTKGGKGTGLGLAVTKKIVEEHQGTIQVESAIDVGTEFTAVLPINGSQPSA